MKLSVPESEDNPAQASQAYMRVRATQILCLSLVSFVVSLTTRAQDSAPSEYQLKAAFLLNFAKFVDWPATTFPETNSPMVLGILGENPFGDDLERTIQNKSVNEHPLVLKAFRSSSEVTNCHILFISTSEKNRLQEILPGFRRLPVLTVGEMDRFIESGGMINFVRQGNKIRFRINEAAAKNGGLKISSKLLNIALPPTQ